VLIFIQRREGRGRDRGCWQHYHIYPGRAEGETGDAIALLEINRYY
jgi:hypothetical protein